MNLKLLNLIWSNERAGACSWAQGLVVFLSLHATLCLCVVFVSSVLPETPFGNIRL